MARIVNGTLYVGSYNPTLNSGEYDFTNAVFENQTDSSGQGALAIQTGFLVYTPATDPVGFFPLPGVAHRYKITNIMAADTTSLTARILWDEDGSQVDLPTNGSYAVVTEDTTHLKFGLPASNGVYDNLPAGIVEAAYNADIRRITDKLGFTGLQGVTGLRGVTGLAGGGTGMQGQTGLQGQTGVGYIGSDGATGVQGQTGLQGEDGLQGLQGQTGVQGQTGLIGNTGVKGATGSAGRGINWRYTHEAGVPESGTRYLKSGSIVCSSCGDRLPTDSTLCAISIKVDSVDTTRTYDAQIITSPSATPVVISTLSLPLNTIGLSTNSVLVGIPADTEVGVRLFKTGGIGESTFNAIDVNIALAQ